jgi:hypothetical protein
MRIPYSLAAVATLALVTAMSCRPAEQTPEAAGPPVDAAALEGANQVVPHVVDSQAVRILRRSMDYLAGLQRFSAKTTIITEDLLDTGNRVDFHSWGSMIVERPNKLHGERHAVGFEQHLYYDGAKLTLYDATRKAYATLPAPATMPGMFELAYDSLDLTVPISDLVWPDNFPLLMQGVTLARVMDREIIDGILCEHLVFSRPDVEFQVWVPVEGAPLPSRYIVTDPGTPALLSIITTLTDWRVNERVPGTAFTFVPPKGAQEVPFLPPGAGL